MWIVAIKELREYSLTLRYQVAAVLLVVLIVLSAAIGALEYRAGMAAHRAAANIDAQSRQEDASLREVFSRTLRYQPPPAPASVLAAGLSDLLTRPVTFRLHFWRDLPVALEPPAVEAGVAGLFPRPDLAWVVAVVGFLLALAFVHDAVAGERARGTLKLILASPVPRAAVIFGKLLGAWLSLLLPLGVALALGALVLVFAAPEAIAGLASADSAAVLGLTFLFLFWVASLGVALSAWCRRPATALFLGLLLWVFLVGVVPASAPALAAQLRPLEPSKALDAAREEVAEQVSDEYDRRHPSDDDHDMDAFLAKRRLMRQAAQKEVDDPYFQKLLAQVRLARGFCLASPVSCYLLAASDLAGTGVEAYAAHAMAAQEFNRAVDAALVDVFDSLRREFPKEHPGQIMNRPFALEVLPAWQPARPPRRDVIRAVVPAVAVLATASLLQLVLAVVGFLRYDPL